MYYYYYPIVLFFEAQYANFVLEMAGIIKNPPKPPYSELQVLFLPYFLFFIWLPETVSVTYCAKKESHSAILSCL